MDLDETLKLTSSSAELRAKKGMTEEQVKQLGRRRQPAPCSCRRLAK